MKLSILMDGIKTEPIPAAFKDFDVKALSCDSRTIKPGSLFFALKGTLKDGAAFIDEAIQKGARVVVHQKGVRIQLLKDVCFLSADDVKAVMEEAANRFFNYPAQKIKVIGVTGTNGKTTITYLLEKILNLAEEKCGVIGTVNYRVGDKVYPAQNTTPGFLDLQELLAAMMADKARYCIMEVSSHALDQGRVNGIDFAAAIFTNLTQDHLDYHKNMEEYFLAKSKLFMGLAKKSCAIVNADSAYGRRLKDLTTGRLLTYGLEAAADVTAQDITLSLDGSTFKTQTPQGDFSLRTSLIGRHNISNILAVVAAAIGLGIDREAVIDGVQALTVVPGRLERVDCRGGSRVFIDYAHTDDALYNVLTNLKNIGRNRLIVVFGCGGDRDRAKRPKMGRVVDELADFAIITSDNPRSEDPLAIIEEIKKGFKGNNFEVIADREKAIQKAMSLAKPQDIVLIAGKGHENYQIFKDRVFPFDDKRIAGKYCRC